MKHQSLKTMSPLKATMMQVLQLSTTLFLVACGASKEVQQTPSQDNPIVDTQSKVFTDCSIDMSRQVELGMKVQVFQNGTQGRQEGWMQTQMLRFPYSFSANDERSLQFWTRTISDTGHWAPFRNVRFYVRVKNQPVSGFDQTHQNLTWKQMKEFGAYYKYNIQTVQDFFNAFELIPLLDAQGQSKVLTLALYDGNTITHQVTALAPAFDVNADRYLAQRLRALAELHPLMHLAGKGFTDAQFAHEAKAACF